MGQYRDKTCGISTWRNVVDVSLRADFASYERQAEVHREFFGREKKQMCWQRKSFISYHPSIRFWKMLFALPVLRIKSCPGCIRKLLGFHQLQNELADLVDVVFLPIIVD